MAAPPWRTARTAAPACRARYNPHTGTYSRGAAAWGPYGARGAGQAYNPRTGTYAQTRQGSNVYGSWGSTSVQRGDQWAQTARVTNNRTGTTTRVTQGSGGGTAVSRNTPGPGGSTVARTGSGDVYAGRDGNVYKKSGDSWQKYDGERRLERREPAGDRRGHAGSGCHGDAAGAQTRDRAATGGGTTAGTRPATADRAGQAGAGVSRWTAGRSTSSTATRGRVPKAPRGPATPGPRAQAATAAARPAAIARAAAA